MVGALAPVSANTSPNTIRGYDSATTTISTTTHFTEDPGVRHSRLQLIWGLVGQIWGWAVLAVLLLAGWSPRLRDVAARWTGNRIGSLIPYVVLLSALLTLLGLPIAYYRGFVIEHEFGLSNQTFWAWLEDLSKGFALNLIGSVILFSLVYLFVSRFPRRWWLYSAALVIFFTVVIATIAPVVIAPLFNKFEPLQDQGLKQEVLQLADRGGVEVADVLQVDMSRQTNAANAYFTGIGPTKRIVLGDTLLANFTKDEILTIVAHEMGHQVHNDLWRGIGVGVIFFLVGFYLLYRIAELTVSRFGLRLGFRQMKDSASLPLILLLIGIISFLAQPAENTFSRYVEHEADVYSLNLTHMNDAYADALKKLGEINVSDPDPPEWIEFIFYTHPSLRKRIDFARSYRPPSAGLGPGVSLAP